MVSWAVDCDPVPTDAGSWPNARLTVSSFLSESLVVEIVNVFELSVSAKVRGVPSIQKRYSRRTQRYPV